MLEEAIEHYLGVTPTTLMDYIYSLKGLSVVSPLNQIILLMLDSNHVESYLKPASSCSPALKQHLKLLLSAFKVKGLIENWCCVVLSPGPKLAQRTSLTSCQAGD